MNNGDHFYDYGVILLVVLFILTSNPTGQLIKNNTTPACSELNTNGFVVDLYKVNIPLGVFDPIRQLWVH